MEYKMNLHPRPFEMIKNGEKCVEMRLFDERRRDIKSGDTIVFTNTKSAEELRTEVVAVNVYADFYELYKNYLKTEIGYLEDEVADPADMYEYYPPEKIAQYGAFAIRIKLI